MKNLPYPLPEDYEDLPPHMKIEIRDRRAHALASLAVQIAGGGSPEYSDWKSALAALHQAHEWLGPGEYVRRELLSKNYFDDLLAEGAQEAGSGRRLGKITNPDTLREKVREAFREPTYPLHRTADEIIESRYFTDAELDVISEACRRRKRAVK